VGAVEKPVASVLDVVDDAMASDAGLNRERQERDRSYRLGHWHESLRKRHTRGTKRIEERLATMRKNPPCPVSVSENQAEFSSPTSLQDIRDDITMVSIELTEEEQAQTLEETAAFVARPHHRSQLGTKDSVRIMDRQESYPEGTVLVENAAAAPPPTARPPVHPGTRGRPIVLRG